MTFNEYSIYQNDNPDEQKQAPVDNDDPLVKFDPVEHAKIEEDFRPRGQTKIDEETRARVGLKPKES